ncbi:MAG: glycosyltransferase family 87 protein [Dehalococcoidales bacterium]|nr:glycosyltransferase family 87 protein [Dehalococcoidales bacterium]
MSKPKTTGRVNLPNLAIVLVGLAALGLIAVSFTRLIDSLSSPSSATDFTQYYLAARAVLEGRSAYSDLAERAVAAGTQMWTDSAPYPPVFQLIMLPFAGMEYGMAWWSWSLLSLACIGLAVLVIYRTIGLRIPLAALPLVTAALASFAPLHHQVLFGQVTGLLFLLITFTWFFYRRGWYGAAGWLLGLTCALKPFPAPLALYFLRQRNWRALAATGASFVLFTLLGAFPLGPGQILTYYRDILPKLSQYYDGLGNASVFGLVYKAPVVLPEDPAGQVLAFFPQSAVAAVLALAVLVYALRGCDRQPSNGRTADMEISALIPAILLASPITWPHYLVFLYLPGLVWLARFREGEVASRSILRLFLLAVVLLSVPAPTGLIAWLLTAGEGAGLVLGRVAALLVTSLGCAGLAILLWTGVAVLRQRRAYAAA